MESPPDGRNPLGGPTPAKKGDEMKISMEKMTYPAGEVTFFFRSKERHGDLSNMTFGFPLKVNGIHFQGPEGLYQAEKYPRNVPHQNRIAEQRSGMDAKKVAYQNKQVRPDWEEVKIDAMAYTLALKLKQHPERFGRALAETMGKPIVEKSQRDDFWGAMPNRDETALSGQNVLGKLLTELRETLLGNNHNVDEAVREYLQEVYLGTLSVNGNPVRMP